jgi:hypothetical protein
LGWSMCCWIIAHIILFACLTSSSCNT